MKKNKKRILVVIIIIVLALIGIGVSWMLDGYGPDEYAIDAMKSSEIVKVVDTDSYIGFYPVNFEKEKQSGLLFYQGAKVDAEAYAVLGSKLAENGIPFIVAKMPVRFAIFDANKAIKLYEELNLDSSWAIGGHSLGGSMASKVVYENPTHFSSLILLASYPAKSNALNDYQIKVLSLWASRDALVTKEKIETHKKYLPSDTKYVEIQGGNHAQFGSYGEQKGDNKADIEGIKQIDLVVEEIVKTLNQN